MTDRAALAAIPVRFSVWICGMFAVLLIAAGLGLPRFEIDASAETLLTRNNALYLQSRQMNQRFSPEEFVLVGLKAREDSLYSPASLQAIDALVSELEEMERVQKVNAITNMPLIAGSSDVSLESDLESFTWRQQGFDEATMRSLLDEHPVYTGLLVSEAQDATALQIVFRENAELEDFDRQLLALELQQLDSELNAEEQQQLDTLTRQKQSIDKQLGMQRSAEVEQIYALLKPYEEQFESYLGGTYVLAYHLIEIISSDLMLFGSLIAVVVMLLLYVLFRDMRWVGIALLGCGVSVVLTMGLFGWLGMKTTVISSNFIALQLILSLALMIHLIVHYQHLARQDESLSHHDLLQKTVQEKMAPCLYAGITTSVGFAALLISNLQPVISFGWMMIAAMAISMSVSLLLFPAVLSFFRHRLVVMQPGLLARGLEVVNRFCHSQGKLIVLIAVVTTGIAIAGVLRLDAENSFLSYFKASTQVHEELTFIDQELGGTTTLDIVVSPEQRPEELVVDASAMQELQRIQLALEGSAAMGKTLSVVNFAELAKELNGGQPLTEYELNSLYTLIDTDIREQLTGAYMDADSGDLRLSARIKDSTPGLDRKAFLASVKSSLQEMGVPQERYILTNVFVLYQDILERLLDSQINTIALVYVVLWLVMLLIFRSFRIATIALIPNVIVTVWILGLMGWLGIPLDLMTITIAAIAMGIAVDDTIHFVHHYLHPDPDMRSDQLSSQAREEDKADSMTLTFHSVGLALVITSGVIAAGFAVLGFSDFIPSVLFGLLTGTAMLMALFTDLTLLPVLLRRFVRASGNRGSVQK